MFVSTFIEKAKISWMESFCTDETQAESSQNVLKIIHALGISNSKKHKTCMRLNSNSKCAFYFYSRISNNSFFCSRKNDGKSPWNNNFSRHCPKGLIFRKGVTKMSSFGVKMQLNLLLFLRKPDHRIFI